MRAVVTVIGKDQKGIIARLTAVLWKHGANVLDITQNVLQSIFAMVMLVDIGELTEDFFAMKDALEKAGEEIGVKVIVMHEDIFNSMHKI